MTVLQSEAIDMNFLEYMSDSRELDNFVIIGDRMMFHYTSIESIADYIEDQYNLNYQGVERKGDMVDLIITIASESLDQVARAYNKIPISRKEVERLIFLKLSVKIHAGINRENEELIQDLLDDLNNPANENPLNITQ